ncbi:probable arginine--tRNA ligase, mitochondrial [Colletes gigas]|uniref:probable arginine--tRNA ligase, mitochondrial n=1 Tax=Colletes gigas TaxID=935657 RepID=UPI001C9A2E6B|nr:probable arginine--tRNA ligase, mitochondrial [Colletes gigas]
MSNSLRSIIFKKVVKPLTHLDNAYQNQIMTNLHVNLNKANNMYCFTLPLKSDYYNITNEVQNIVKNDSDDTFDNIIIKDSTIYFNMQRDKYIKTIIESNQSGVTPPLLVSKNKNIIVEFSSPNIAKPFHLGHLRSTIIGNYIANINNFLHNKVKKINYLGDWGTQFGFIYLGLEMLCDNNNLQLQNNPIETLYRAYVTANKLAETDSTINERAKEIFRQLEFGDIIISNKWETFKDYTVQELEKTYKRLGVIFDEYHWESMYAGKNINKIISLMEELQLLTLDMVERKVIPLNEERNIPIIKSDGSTLYITRDIAAAVDRFEKYKFDNMYYVVENGQTDYFSTLIQILNKMGMPWSHKLMHVKFGRVRGMSTRRGTAIFLHDILNKAQEIMKKRQLIRPTTKVNFNEFDESSDILGMSGIILNDLKQRRMKDYTFDWNLLFNMKGDTGIKLQYTHCRLNNLKHTTGATLITECNPSLLKEEEIDNLIILISQFDEVILKSYKELEPCILVVYLFSLCNAVSKTFKNLRIKGESSDLGNQRLLLFHTVKIILAESMKLLGLIPLNRM